MQALIEYAPLLGQGALTTIMLALASILLATALGALGAWGKLARSPISKGVAAAYTTLVRGVPDLVLMLLVFYGGQRLLNTTTEAIGLGRVDVSAFAAGVFTIGFIFGAYLTETFRGAYMAVPRGQREAARSLGLGGVQTFLTVTAPQLIRHALPGFGNVWLVLVKSTAIVSIIGLEDVVGLADKAGKSTRQQFWFFLAVILVFLAITAVSSWALRRLEAHYAPPERASADDEAGAPSARSGFGMAAAR